MQSFYRLLVTALIVSTTNNFVWFAITYWVYLETRSVVSTGLVGGIFLLATTMGGFWFGSLVDRFKKKNVMLGSSLATLTLFSLGLFIYLLTPEIAFSTVLSPILWLFVGIL